MSAAFEKAVAHGIVRAGMASLRGQKVSAGFCPHFVAGFSRFAPARSGFVASGFAAPKSFGIEKGTFVNAVVGGTTSELTSGKFANGAVTGAFVHLFNDMYDSLFFNGKGVPQAADGDGKSSDPVAIKLEKQTEKDLKISTLYVLNRVNTISSVGLTSSLYTGDIPMATWSVTLHGIHS